MEKFKKILSAVSLVGLILLFILVDLKTDIKDTNGPDDYSLQQITDSNIIRMDVQEGFCKPIVTAPMPSYRSSDFSGVCELFSEEIISSRMDIILYSAEVSSGNFKIAVLCNDEIVHEFKLNELWQRYTVENTEGTVSLRIAGESANFYFGFEVNKY